LLIRSPRAAGGRRGAACALDEEREGREDGEWADDDESVEHCDQFLPQNVARVTPEGLEPAWCRLFFRRLGGRQLQRDFGVGAFAHERVAAALEPPQGLLVARAARPGDASVEPVESGLEVGHGDPLSQDRPELGEAGDRLLHVLRRDAEIEPRIAARLAGRVVRRSHVATKPSRLANGVLRRAREIVDAEPHRDLLLLETRLGGEARCQVTGRPEWLTAGKSRLRDALRARRLPSCRDLP
jgi:hypothetical protein